jgi:TPP-dependent 2-oxoacid decarboxylase
MKSSDSDPLSMREAVDETIALLEKAERPVIIAGVEIHRFGLHDQLLSHGGIVANSRLRRRFWGRA